MNALPFILSALVGLGIVFLLVPIIVRFSLRAGLDRGRDFHRMHKVPVPRLGGLALAGAFIGIELFLALFFPAHHTPLANRYLVVFSPLAMFGLGFWDDLQPLGVMKKLLGQILIAGVVCAFGIGIQKFKVPFADTIIDLGGWGVLITILWLVGLTNLISLIDGVDGLAGGICLMLMGLLAYAGHQSGSFELLLSGMAGALLAFLWFNFPPARIYLGNGGAYFLGFQIGLFSMLNSHKGTVFAALVAPLFVLALPILDTSIAVLRRGLPTSGPLHRRGKRVFTASGSSRRNLALSLLGGVAFWLCGPLVPALLGLALLTLLLLVSPLNLGGELFAVGHTVGNSLEVRQQVRYAFCLTRWLGLEADRCDSLAAFWREFMRAARKLGFTAIKFTFGDRECCWEYPDASGLMRSFRFEPKGGQYGVLELWVPSQPKTEATLVSMKDPRVSSTIAKLLAETWFQSARRWHPGLGDLKFDLPTSASTSNVARTRVGGSTEPLPGIFSTGIDAAARRLIGETEYKSEFATDPLDTYGIAFAQYVLAQIKERPNEVILSRFHQIADGFLRYYSNDDRATRLIDREVAEVEQRMERTIAQEEAFLQEEQAANRFVVAELKGLRAELAKLAAIRNAK